MTDAREAGRPRPSRRPRYRYIAFRVDLPEGTPRPNRKEGIDLVQRAAETQGATAAQPWLTRFDGQYGVLRVLRGTEEEGVRLLRSVASIEVAGRTLPARVETLLTSGTIAGLERKVFGGAKIGG